MKQKYFIPYEIILNQTPIKLNSHNDNQNVHENGNGDESDSDENNSHSEVSEDDSEDQEHYVVYQKENNGIENSIHLPQIPIINYASDVEHKEDFGNGWEWTEKDPGSSCGPFISQPRLLIEPPSRTLKGFFNLLFDNSMWTLLAQQTNIYAKDTTIQGYHIRGI